MDAVVITPSHRWSRTQSDRCRPAHTRSGERLGSGKRASSPRSWLRQTADIGDIEWSNDHKVGNDCRVQRFGEKTTGNRSAGLDGLRGIAILLVIGSHLSAARLPLGGMAGVTLFFVLSGYLITSILLKEREKFGGIHLPAFYARRALRLLPALLLVLGACPLILWVLDDPRLGKNLLGASAAALFYAGDFVRASGDPMVVLGHTWSLAVEEQFYLVWPFALLGLTSRSGSRTTVARVVAIAALALLAWRLASPALFGFDRIYFAPDTNAFALLLGGWLACRNPRISPRWAPSFTASSVGLLVVLSIIQVRPGSHAYYMSLELGAGAAGLLALAAVAGARSWSSVLGRQPLVFFGRISYGLYLWHEVLLFVVPPRTGVVGRAGIVILSVLIATASWLWIEKPVLRRRTAFERKDESPDPLRNGPIVIALDGPNQRIALSHPEDPRVDPSLHCMGGTAEHNVPHADR
jgi:peptidoglycan/LPS O-acetylase OafA/YrhL